MKAIILIIVVVLSSIHLEAQIGIKTSSPKALFHIDAAGDNPANPATPLTEAQAFNDVIIDSSGAFSVGTTEPLAKFHMFNTPVTTALTQPTTFKIEDPNKLATTQALHTDNNAGIANWAPLPDNGVSTAYSIPDQPASVSVITIISLQDINSNTVTTIPITKSGRYLFTFTISARALPLSITSESGRGPTLSTYVYLFDSAVTPNDNNWIDAIEYYMPVGNYNYTGSPNPTESLYNLTFTTTLFAASLTAGQSIKIGIKPMIGVANSWAFVNNVSSVIVYNI